MTRSSLRVLSAALAAGLLLVTAGTSTSAAAAEPDLRAVDRDRGAPAAPAPADETVSTGESCAIQGRPLAPGQDPAELAPAPEVCFDSLEEALEFVSGADVAAQRLVGASSGDVSALVTELNAGVALEATTSRTTAAAAASSLVLGVLWRDTGFKGTSKVLYGQGANGCWTGSTYGFSNLASYLMNNVVSSASTYAGCWVTLYDSYSYAGAKWNCTPNCSSLGTFDNRASSVVYRPAGTLG